MGQLTLNNNNFLQEYLFGENKGNGAQSYANVYTDGEIQSSSAAAASALLRKPESRAEIKRLTDEHIEVCAMYKIKNMEMLSKIAEELATDIPIDNHGNPLPVHQYRATSIRAIGEINNMIGGHKPKEARVEVDNRMQFVFNVVPPKKDGDSIIDITPEEEF